MIKSLEIKNFKSIQDQRVELGDLNVLIGPNGSGKSNFISLFKFLERLSEKRLAEYIYQAGGIENFLFQGFEKSQNLKIALSVKSVVTDEKSYEIEILSDGERYQIKKETIGEKGIEGSFKSGISNNSQESQVFGEINNKLFPHVTQKMRSSMIVAF